MISDAACEEQVAVHAGVVDDRLLLDRFTELVVELELPGREVEMLTARKDVPAVLLDRLPVAQDRGDHQRATEVVLDDLRGDRALPTSGVRRGPQVRVVGGVRLPRRSQSGSE